MIQFNDAVQCIFNRLLDVLADRKAKKGLSGHVLINGRRQPHNFKCASAYVVQVSHDQDGVNPLLHTFNTVVELGNSKKNIEYHDNC